MQEQTDVFTHYHRHGYFHTLPPTTAGNLSLWWFWSCSWMGLSSPFQTLGLFVFAAEDSDRNWQVHRFQRLSRFSLAFPKIFPSLVHSQKSGPMLGRIDLLFSLQFEFLRLQSLRQKQVYLVKNFKKWIIDLPMEQPRNTVSQMLSLLSCHAVHRRCHNKI